MAIAQPGATDPLNTSGEDHATLHRIIAADTSATAESLTVNSSSVVTLLNPLPQGSGGTGATVLMATSGSPAITVGTGLSFTGGTLSNTGSGFVPNNIQVFTSSGTWTKPAGVSQVYVKVIGGGGNGGNASNSNSGADGPGGAGGVGSGGTINLSGSSGNTGNGVAGVSLLSPPLLITGVNTTGRNGNPYGGGATGGTSSYQNGGCGGGGGYAEGVIAVTGNVTVTIGATNSFAGSTTIQATAGSNGSSGGNGVGGPSGVGGTGDAGAVIVYY